eukprot:8382694-Pyramimonas_sp.AAC.1
MSGLSSGFGVLLCSGPTTGIGGLTRAGLPCACTGWEQHSTNGRCPHHHEALHFREVPPSARPLAEGEHHTLVGQ